MMNRSHALSRTTARANWVAFLRLALLLLLPLTVHLMPARAALRLPEGMVEVSRVEGITEYALPHGLRVLLFPDPSRPIITVNITYRVGSRHEDYGEKGMAHLLEHLVFKGTPKHPNIPQELTEHGARANGTTWFDRTNYYETFDATEANLRWALELEADRMIHSFIARKDLESEFSVVRSEFEMGENNPAAVLYKRMLGTVFQWHNYGRSTIGEKSDIEGAPIERLQAFYRKYYQPDNAVLVVAGKLDAQLTLDCVHHYFSGIPRPSRVLLPTYTKEPIQDGERLVTLRRVGDVQVASVMYRLAPGAHADFAALTVLGRVLTDEPSGRLYRALIEGKKAARIYGDVVGLAEAGLVQLEAEVRPEQSLAEAKDALLGVLDSLGTQPPTEEELRRARTRLLKEFELALKRSDRIGLLLSEYIGMGDWRLAFLQRDRIEAVSREDLARVARFYFKPANRTVGLFIPEAKPDRTEVPAPPVLATLLQDYRGKAPIAEGEDFDPSPAQIEARTTRGRLANGLRYAFLPKKTRGESVRATITLRFGDLESLRGQAVVAEMTASMLDKGTVEKTRQQIQDSTDRLKARVTVFGDAASATVSMDTDRSHLAELLQLVGELLRRPSFAPEEFERLRQERLSDIEQNRSEPGALAQNLFARLSEPSYPAGDPRATLTMDDEKAAVEAVTVERMRAFHQRFFGASDATAAVVGDFDPASIESTLRSVLGDWRSPSPFTRLTEDYVPVPVRSETILTPDKANAVTFVGYGFAMRDDDPQYPALSMAGYLMGGGFLNSRLAVRIRQKEGLSYGVGGGFFASQLDRNGQFRAQMIFNPTNVVRLEAAFREEIERAAKDGFTVEELEPAKTGWLQSQKVRRTSDTTLAGLLSDYLFWGRDFTREAAREDAVKKLSVQEVNAAAKAYLDYGKMIRVRAGDFKKGEHGDSR